MHTRTIALERRTKLLRDAQYNICFSYKRNWMTVCIGKYLNLKKITCSVSQNDACIKQLLHFRLAAQLEIGKKR